MPLTGRVKMEIFKKIRSAECEPPMNPIATNMLMLDGIENIIKV